MTDVDDLATWLPAQVDTDERVALAAAEGGDGRWTAGTGHSGCYVEGDRIKIYDEGGHTAEQAQHIALHDPKRELAEVAFKRGILAEHDSYSGYGERCQTCHRLDDLAGDPWPCTTLRLLALPYADRPGYREEWRP